MTWVMLAVLVVGCGLVPSIEDILKRGVNCKAEIQTPEMREGPFTTAKLRRGGETVEVRVKIFDCTEAK